MKVEWKNITKLELEEHFSNGLWYEDIADKYEVTHRTVRDKTAKFGIKLDRKNKKKESELHICKVCGKTYRKSINDGFCSSNCKTLHYNTNNKQILPIPTTELGNKIIEFRKLGLSQKNIAQELGCSKSTVSYWCSKTTKIKVKERADKLSKDSPAEYKFIKHMDNFKRRKCGVGQCICNDWNKKIRTAVSRFRRRTATKGIYKKEMLEKNYTYKEAIDHLGGMKTKCYLTGKEIDLEKDDYCLDHIVPITKGGSNELENIGITIPSANASKSDLSLEEYLNLCKDVLENFGYTISK